MGLDKVLPEFSLVLTLGNSLVLGSSSFCVLGFCGHLGVGVTACLLQYTGRLYVPDHGWLFRLAVGNPLESGPFLLQKVSLISAEEKPSRELWREKAVERD